MTNEHNALVPRDWWLEPWEKVAILDFHAGRPLEGYRRLAFMMLDVVAVSPSSVYRVLRDAGLLNAHNSTLSLNGKGFQQPLRVHEHWHVDVSYINVAGTCFYLCSLLDGCNRYIANWEIRESMTEAEIETIIQRARERHPDARPRAPWRHDPCADPGARTEGGRHDAALTSPFGIGMKAANRRF